MSQNFKEIDSKFESRQRKLFSEKTLLEIKEESMDKELTLGRSIKEKLCLQKRMQQKIQKDSNNENSNSSKIENILTISPELYKKCKIAEVTLDNVLKDVPLINEIFMKILEVQDVVYGNNVSIKVQVNSSATTLLNIGFGFFNP